MQIGKTRDMLFESIYLLFLSYSASFSLFSSIWTYSGPFFPEAKRWNQILQRVFDGKVVEKCLRVVVGTAYIT